MRNVNAINLIAKDTQIRIGMVLRNGEYKGGEVKSTSRWKNNSPTGYFNKQRQGGVEMGKGRNSE